MAVYRIRLSKFLSYILRHAPHEYNLKLDKNGYAEIEKVLSILGEKFRFFKKEDLFSLVKSDRKGRFEIADNKIRATYGHSIEIAPKAKPVTPPEFLYHGTSGESAEKIASSGLRPMGRQFVHLSLNESDAYAVGLRHTENPVILKIMAKDASLRGVKFFKAGCVFLVEYVPGEFIKP